MRTPLRWLMLSLCLQAGALMATELHFVTEDFPPFTYALGEPSSTDEATRAAGPLAEIVQAVCTRLQYRCRIDIHPWRRALALAERGEADGIFTVVRSPRRETFLRITRMLVTSRYSVFARDGHYVFSQPKDLAGRTVGVYGPSGTSYVLSERLRQVGGVQVQMVPDNRQLLRMLASGRFGEEGLAVINQDVAWHLIEDEGLGGLREAGQLEPVSYGIGLSRKSIGPAQFQLFEQALDALILDGTVPTILRRHQLEPAYRSAPPEHVD